MRNFKLSYCPKIIALLVSKKCHDNYSRFYKRNFSTKMWHFLHQELKTVGQLPWTVKSGDLTNELNWNL